jgi:hypothetical protein
VDAHYFLRRKIDMQYCNIAKVDEALAQAEVCYARVGRAVSEDKPTSEYLASVQAFNEAFDQLRSVAVELVPIGATIKSEHFVVTSKKKANRGQVDFTNADLLIEALHLFGWNAVKGLNQEWVAQQGPDGERIVGAARATRTQQDQTSEKTISLMDRGAYKFQLEITNKHRELMARCDKAYEDWKASQEGAE